jgi:hypothetical protein
MLAIAAAGSDSSDEFRFVSGIGSGDEAARTGSRSASPYNPSPSNAGATAMRRAAWSLSRSGTVLKGTSLNIIVSPLRGLAGAQARGPIDQGPGLSPM